MTDPGAITVVTHIKGDYHIAHHGCRRSVCFLLQTLGNVAGYHYICGENRIWFSMDMKVELSDEDLLRATGGLRDEYATVTASSIKCQEVREEALCQNGCAWEKRSDKDARCVEA